MAAEKDPCGGGGAGASRSAVSLDWRATLALGEHLSHPPRLPRKVFFTPPCPSSAPTLSPARVGLGPLVKKVTRSHQLLLPLGTGGGTGDRRREGPRRTSSLSAAATGAVRPGAPARPGPRRGLPPSVRVCVPVSGSIQLLYSCLQRHSERARRGREGVCLQSAAPWCSEAAAPAPTLIHFTG